MRSGSELNRCNSRLYKGTSFMLLRRYTKERHGRDVSGGSYMYSRNLKCLSYFESSRFASSDKINFLFKTPSRELESRGRLLVNQNVAENLFFATFREGTDRGTLEG